MSQAKTSTSVQKVPFGEKIAYGLGDAATAAGVLAAAGVEAGDSVDQMQGVLTTIGSVASITGREFTPVDFLDYLEAKYSELYGL